MRSGMMKGTLLESLPIASRSSGNGFLSTIEKVLSSAAFISPTVWAIAWPRPSRFIQRASEAMQSAERTGVPSWNLRPSRKVKV